MLVNIAEAVVILAFSGRMRINHGLEPTLTLRAMDDIRAVAG